MHWLLFAYTFALAVNVGGALLATAVIFPAWSASPEAASGWTGVVNEAPFFVVVSPIVLLLAIATLILSSRAPQGRRAWIRVSTGLYLVFFVATLTYFVPGQAALHGATGVQLAPAASMSQLQQWVTLNWIRQALGMVALGAALHSLGRGYGAPLARR